MKFHTTRCRRSQKHNGREPCGSGPHRDTDPEDAPITVMELHLVTAQYNSIIGERTQSPEED